MPGRRAILHSAIFACVVVAAVCAQAIRASRAADECLAQPDGPAPQGQHWYYRIDHANNNRQCWRLAPEGLPVRNTAPQSEEDAVSRPGAQQQPRVPKAETQPAISNAAPANAAKSVATMPSVPWPQPSSLPFLLPVPPPQPQAQPQAEPQTTSADSALPETESAAKASAKPDPSPTGSVQAGRPQHPTAEKFPSSAAAAQQPGGVDRKSVLLAVVLALLAVTGPILHFTHRRRQRDLIKNRPPRWAPVVPPNTSAPRVRVAHTPEPSTPHRPARRAVPPAVQTDWRRAPELHRGLVPAPDPGRDARPYSRPAPTRVLPAALPPDGPNERLAHALQKLADRMQTIQTPEARPAQRADFEMMKRAR